MSKIQLMTDEEAKERIQSLYNDWLPVEYDFEVYDTEENRLDREAFMIAIKAIEAQPCEDCVSRQAVRETIFAECSGDKLDIDFAKVLLLQRAIKALPSVTPQPKKGKWILYDVDIAPHPLHCSLCGFSNHHINNRYIREFRRCPNCGVEMEVNNADSN